MGFGVPRNSLVHFGGGTRNRWNCLYPCVYVCIYKLGSSDFQKPKCGRFFSPAAPPGVDKARCEGVHTLYHL